MDIFWIRHSTSKANISNLYQRIFDTEKKYHDPVLTKEGEESSLNLSKQLPEKLKDIKYILCSELKRSIQTAILLFPENFLKKKIKICPGVQETGIGFGNIKKSKKETNIFLFHWCKNLNIFQISDKKLEDCIKSLSSDLTKNNWGDILGLKNVNEERYMNYLIPYLKKRRLKKIVIVSHSLYIRDEIMSPKISRENFRLLSSDTKLYNNQILEKNFIYKDKELELKEEKIFTFGSSYNGKYFYNDVTYNNFLNTKIEN